MKKSVIITLLAFLCSIAGYSQKAVVPHAVKKTVVKKTPQKAAVTPYGNYWGYGSYAKVDAAYDKNHSCCDVHRSDYGNFNSPPYVAGSDTTYEKAADENMRILSLGYVPKYLRGTANRTEYSDAQKAKIFINQNTSPFGGKVTCNPAMY